MEEAVGFGLMKSALSVISQGWRQAGKSLMVRIGFKPLPHFKTGTRIEIYVDIVNTSQRRVDLSDINCEVWACGEDGLNDDKWIGLALNKHAPDSSVWLEAKETHTERYWIVVGHSHRFVRIWANAGSKQGGLLWWGKKTSNWQYHEVLDVQELAKEASIGASSQVSRH